VKIASYIVDGRRSYGAVADGRVCDFGVAEVSRCPTLREALNAGAIRERFPEACELNFDRHLTDVQILPPITEPSKIICVGTNYAAHAAEIVGAPVRTQPSIFVRLANTLVPHEGSIVRPVLSDELDFEGELAIIIGKSGRHLKRDDALAHVAGYSIFNDASIRNYQFEHSLAAGKNFVSTGGFGPWLITADELPDPSSLTIETRLNGIVVQHASTADMVRDVADIIAYVSAITPLEVGDVIATGTPEGVGFARKPPLWMKAGDTVEVEIGGIGILRNHVVDERIA